jgi:hypothetical protein
MMRLARAVQALMIAIFCLHVQRSGRGDVTLFAKEPSRNKRFGLGFAPIEDSGSAAQLLRFADDR